MAALGAAAFLAARLLARAPGFTEAVYANAIWPVIARPISGLTGWFPFPVWEVLAAAWVLWLLGLAGLALPAALMRRRRVTSLFAHGARRLLRDAGIIVFAFYVLWGFNYARPAHTDRAGWPAWDGADATEIARLAEEAVELANQAYHDLHGSDDAGVPTRLPADMAGLEAALDSGWVLAAERLELPRAAAAHYGRTKRPWISWAMPRLGIAGLYIPFTGEANVPRGLPAARTPHSMAHEKAHQRGFTSEAEAGFLGFVAGMLAPDPLARYAAALYAQTQLLSALFTADRDEALRISGRRLPGLVRDLQDLNAWYARHAGPGVAVGRIANNAFLQANRVQAGVRDYGRSIRLMVLWARRNSERLDPAVRHGPEGPDGVRPPGRP